MNRSSTKNKCFEFYTESSILAKQMLLRELSALAFVFCFVYRMLLVYSSSFTFRNLYCRFLLAYRDDCPESSCDDVGVTPEGKTLTWRRS
jgi:hypothetical protein